MNTHAISFRPSKASIVTKAPVPLELDPWTRELPLHWQGRGQDWEPVTLQDWAHILDRVDHAFASPELQELKEEMTSIHRCTLTWFLMSLSAGIGSVVLLILAAVLAAVSVYSGFASMGCVIGSLCLGTIAMFLCSRGPKGRTEQGPGRSNDLFVDVPSAVHIARPP
eukprot:Skav214141  [mRNA]  locus=scaffold1645:123305:123805:- [translate_table: standard]